ncbi:GDSL-type esterase/lipase family protein [Clostridium tertium]|uniref:GDSL-type esterase/lipase family protein n=1 Tax=Clostridium tertium TaxID=1559 RepID=UPI002A7F6411|nr:GDSL-type esterase/lipase family protein [Clostridium tertium]MDY4606621.1 GDSL-type esterase/lipase family protein [Clostridium tertium]
MYLEELNKEDFKFIEADNSHYKYMGRIDFENSKAPTIVYAGSMIKIKFSGASLKIALKNYHSHYENAIGFIIDDEIEGKVVIKEHYKDIVIDIAEGLEDKLHDLVLYKRSDAAHYFDFYGIIIDKNSYTEAVKKNYNRRIECFGDSVSAGEVCEAVDYVGKVDPEGHEGIYSNSWYSYSMITARNLGAEINNNAQGGIAVMDGTGYFNPSSGYLGSESTYDKLRYSPELGECNEWDFSKYTPHVVIMALGQNDAHPENYIDDDKEKREVWKSKYADIITDLRSKYPKALFIVITTILCHSNGWDDALDEMVDKLNDEKIVRYKFKRNGCGTPGHIRIPEAEEMATELTNYIESFGEDIWK